MPAASPRFGARRSTSGADLPLGFSATLSYSLTRTDRFQLLGGEFAEIVTRQHEWPVRQCPMDSYLRRRTP